MSHNLHVARVRKPTCENCTRIDVISNHRPRATALHAWPLVGQVQVSSGPRHVIGNHIESHPIRVRFSHGRGLSDPRNVGQNLMPRAASAERLRALVNPPPLAGPDAKSPECAFGRRLTRRAAGAFVALPPPACSVRWPVDSGDRGRRPRPGAQGSPTTRASADRDLRRRAGAAGTVCALRVDPSLSLGKD